MRLYDAIYKLNSQVVSISNEIAYDAAGNEVAYDKAAAEALVTVNAYKAKRAAEFPPITDYIDGVVKGDQEQIDAYIAACQAVKTKYPKP